MSNSFRLLYLFIFVVIFTGCAAPAPLRSTPTPSLPPPPVSGTPTPPDLVSTNRLFDFLSKITAIQAYSGWRNSATLGERQALDMIQQQLTTLPYLNQLGIRFFRQEFNVFLATELGQTGVELTLAGKTTALPAIGMRGSRDSIEQALIMDSDGTLNDNHPDPVVGSGAAYPILSESDLSTLDQAAGKVLLVDYTLVDSTVTSQAIARQNARDLLNAGPAGILLITQYSSRVGESHGTYAGEGGVFTGLSNHAHIPVLISRLEDLHPAGIYNWEDLAAVESATLTWDADVFSPAASGNLMALIPGRDRSKAVILGAHIDSPNSPGAMDDGSGSAVLMETAQVINQAHVQPPMDVVLVWFGSEELGLYGSSAFANAQQELIDRAVAMLQIDCLTRPLDGVPAELMINYWPSANDGGVPPWAVELQNTAAQRGIALRPMFLPLSSDNASFTGYNLPNVNLILDNERMMEDAGGTWYAGHIHGPYDTVETARDSAAVLKQMAEIAVQAAYLPSDRSSFRSVQPGGKRAVIIASHTEAVHMTPTSLADLGMALAAAGLDVDTVPYGRPLTRPELENAALVIALPVHDYPLSDEGTYDEAWQPEEVRLLREYVDSGGKLLITNTALRLKYTNRTYEENEDRLDANSLAGEFGIRFLNTALEVSSARISGGLGLSGSLLLTSGAIVPFELQSGQTLAVAGTHPVLALTSDEHVMVLADLSALGSTSGGPLNPALLNALARWAISD